MVEIFLLLTREVFDFNVVNFRKKSDYEFSVGSLNDCQCSVVIRIT